MRAPPLSWNFPVTLKIAWHPPASITDEDIDVLIMRGEERTKSMLSEKDKGDAYDFSLKFDGDFKAQEFEGVDYGDAKAR